ncbi:hypothetical protein ABWH96_07995 [Marivirga tractuosa]
MAGFFDELKQNFKRPNNALNQLIIINAVVFVGLGLLALIGKFSGVEGLYAIVDAQFTIPPDLERFIYRP